VNGVLQATIAASPSLKNQTVSVFGNVATLNFRSSATLGATCSPIATLYPHTHTSGKSFEASYVVEYTCPAGFAVDPLIDKCALIKPVPETFSAIPGITRIALTIYLYISLYTSLSFYLSISNSLLCSPPNPSSLLPTRIDTK
jgi:hypothetical protein